ncbi:hypothetical protein COU88_04085 [Candidatus Roizmanbacteria bacterium CG10_big_fil_rev_8_21_14_0_10_39_6]|uniref:Uncharacterized protein n=1 Tax=Candidatus Roizmanbacteria bacterium CG10_big_fil_rev_8_21_14_0_10_39_6 TaxID=1974853 RepID=A0A2M8KRR0_9BACT|nr:MAG: hypothetical protein COU88_04085 [Candidatus Roizmanbacteria bacterium CG10_big_fil_rev_8_21_14_0_10_39_6]
MITRLKNWFSKLPDKKKYLELITAFLTIPVLLTVLLTNVSRIKETTTPQTKTESPATSPTNEIIIREITKIVEPTSESTNACIPEIGIVSIARPKDGEIITQNPFSIDIEYKNSQYCPVVWSYRINGSNWSVFTDKSIDIYNLESGQKKLEVKVRSTISKEEKILSRDFIYDTPSNNIPTPTTIPTVTLTPSPSDFLTPSIT